MASRVLIQKEGDIQMMLAADVHLVTKNCDFQMEQYVFKRRTDGICIINLGKTLNILMLAATVIVAIENPGDIIFQSTRPYGQRAVLKFAQYTGAHSIAGCNTPGTFTNQMRTSFSEPHLLILTDLRTDHQPIKDAALENIPTIEFCDTDSPMRYVDTGIPANNKGKHNIGFLLCLLERLGLQMRITIAPGKKWKVMVDLFFYREPEEAANNKGMHIIGCLFCLLARMDLQKRITIAPGKKWQVVVDLFFYREPEEAKEHQDDAIPGSDYPNEYTLALGTAPVVGWAPQVPADGGWGDAVADAPISALPVDGIPAAPVQATGWK
ncbi:hypothetical protein ACHQM5_024973 [Ranunculus cassubicifolius]